MFDIVYVTYNSEKWIKKCFSSWLDIDYDLKEVNIIIVDNNSTDRTIEFLKEFEKQYGEKFSSFFVIKEVKNWGFGKANNIGFSKGKDEIVCFFNIDTEIYPDTLYELQKDIENSEDKIALWELRQFPYEHPKLYDIITGEVSWSSGAAFAIRRNIYKDVGGFDEKIFMYAEDVDLSWRIRAAGYKLKYAPRVKIMHYSYETAGEIKPNQHVYSIINNLLLRYRFGGPRTILLGHILFWKVILRQESFLGARKKLLKNYWKHFRQIPHFIAKGKYKKFKVAKFIGFDYSSIREGAFYRNFITDQKPLVSIIVRTCGRPSVLRETLLSLRKQTYDNIEIVIVEDGKEISKEMIEKEFSDLNIIYEATGQKVGRSKVGNRAMELSHGKYLNFLDDDDLFYADHVEVLVNTLLNSSNKAAYAFAFETPIIVESKEPYVYDLIDYRGIHKQKFDRIMLCHHNYIPIQCIMFEKDLYQKYGGLDESLDALEDWDLWVRYSLYTDFDCVEKTTSVYRVPYSFDVNEKRQEDLDDALDIVREKHKSYMQPISAYDVAIMYQEQHK